MTNRLLLYTSAALLFVIAFTHALALQGDLYWHYPLLNRAVHGLGGMWVALASVWLLAFRGRTIGALQVLLIVAGVSIAWEVFEVVIGMTREPNYAIDTVLDLCMDLIGGILGYFAGRSMLQSHDNGEDENRPS